MATVRERRTVAPRASCSIENLTWDPIAPLSPEEIENLKKNFRLFDKDDDGTIAKKELGDVLASLGTTITENVLDQMFKEVDQDGSGAIDLGEFVALMTCWSRCVEGMRTRLGTFRQHCLLALFFCAIVAGLCFALWSDLGWGTKCLEILADVRNEWWPVIMVGISIMLLLLLYVFDFFLPPHIPGRICTLSERFSIIGRLFFAASVMLLFGGSLPILADGYPHRPLLMTIYLAPLCIIIIGISTRYYHYFVQKAMRQNIERTGSTLELELFLIVKDIAMEDDDSNFYRGVMAAFCVTGTVCVAVWVPWALFNEVPKASNDDAEAFVLWLSPALVAMAMFTFGAMVSIRVHVHGAYTTIGKKFHERAKVARQESFKNRSQSRLSVSKRESVDVPVTHTFSIASTPRDVKKIQQLKRFAKILVAVSVIVFGLAFAVSSLAFQSSQLASMIRDMLSSFCFSMVIFLVLAFDRLLDKLQERLKVTPYWKPFLKLVSSEWARAVALCIAGPLIIGILFLSMVSQCIRRWRDLRVIRVAASSGSIESGDDAGSRPELWMHYLTIRIRAYLLRSSFWEWNWTSICIKANIFCALCIALFVCPLFFNIFFAFIIDLLRPLQVVWTVLLVFVLGIAALLIPAVPTTTIYVFGGVVMSEKWMSLPSSHGGYWTGIVLCVMLSLFIKLLGRILQYQCFGRVLGKRQWVQQLCKVHTPLMRCVTSMLSEIGYCDRDKIAVLCGMPDWPMGVGAGILRLPLLQVLVGTIPIVFFITPCVLFGAFYIRKDDSEVWTKAFTGSVVAVAIANLVFQVAAAFSIQRAFGRKMDELSHPDPKYIELYWLDHCSIELQQNRHIPWQGVPRCLQILGVTSSVSQICIFHVFFWRWEMCFGRFVVTDDINNLEWHGEDSIIHLVGYGCLGMLLFSYASAYALYRWVRNRQRAQCAQAFLKLQEKKEEWIHQWHDQRKREEGASGQLANDTRGSHGSSATSSTALGSTAPVVLPESASFAALAASDAEVADPSSQPKSSGKSSPCVSPRQKSPELEHLEEFGFDMMAELPVDTTPRGIPCETPSVANLWAALALFGASLSPRQVDCANT